MPAGAIYPPALSKMRVLMQLLVWKVWITAAYKA